MKTNEKFEELKVLLLLNKEKIFDHAMQVANNNAHEAYGRIEIAIGYIVGVYFKLANKKYTLEFLFDKIDECTPRNDKAYNINNDVGEFIENIIDASLKSKKRFSTTLLLSILVAIVVAALVLIVTNIPKAVDPIETVATDENGNVIEVPKGLTIMDGTRRIDGENKTLEIINYQNLTKAIGKKGTFENKTDIKLPINTLSAVTTTPKNETYMVYQNIETEDGSNTTFTLYRLEKSGWEPLASGDVSNGFLPAYGLFWTSQIYIVSDEESNIYIITFLDDHIVVYSYENEENKLIPHQSSYNFGKINQMKNFYVDYDNTSGEHGVIYICLKNIGTLTFLKYDISKGEFSTSKNYSFNVSDYKMCVQNGVIHLVVSSDNGEKLFYYIMEDAFDNTSTYKRILLFNCREKMNENNNLKSASVAMGVTGSGSGGIYIDRFGDANIVTQYDYRYNDDLRITSSLQYFKIHNEEIVFAGAIDNAYESEDVVNQYFGGFITVNESWYLIMLYEGDANNIGVVELNDQEQFELTEMFEIPNNIEKNYGYPIKTRQDSITFSAQKNDYLYFFLVEEKK